MNTSKPAGGENTPKKKHLQVKPNYKKRDYTNGRKGNPKASRQEDQRDQMTESHRTPTTEVHPTKRAGKAEHQGSQKQKELPKMGRQRKNP